MKEKTSHLCFAALRLLDERLLDQDEACQLLSEKMRNKRRAGSSAAAESKSTKQGARTGAGGVAQVDSMLVQRNHSSQAPPAANMARRTSKAPWDSSLASATTPPAPAIVQGRHVAQDGLCHSMLCHGLILSEKP
jgi:hypothetical protein